MAPTKERRCPAKRYSLRPRVTKQRSEIKKKNSLTSSESMQDYRGAIRRRVQITHAKSPKASQSSSSLEDVENEFSSGRIVQEEDKFSRKFNVEFSTLDDEDTDTDSSDVECAICLDTVTDDYRMEEINACKHHFHKSCLQKWMRANKICPVCHTIVPIYIFSDSESETANDERKEENNEESERRSPVPLNESIINSIYTQILDNLDNYIHGSFTTDYELY